MFVVTKYGIYGQVDLYYCRTIEKAKEIFERIFWEWVEKETSCRFPSEPADYDVNTWEELLTIWWENGMNGDDIVRCEKIEYEEDKKA